MGKTKSPSSTAVSEDSWTKSTRGALAATALLYIVGARGLGLWGARACDTSWVGATSSTEHVDAVEVIRSLAQALCHRLLARTQCHARVIVLLVRLLLAVRVADLSL